VAVVDQELVALMVQAAVILHLVLLYLLQRAGRQEFQNLVVLVVADPVQEQRF
jgi:hypothetical protein